MLNDVVVSDAHSPLEATFERDERRLRTFAMTFSSTMARKNILQTLEDE